MQESKEQLEQWMDRKLAQLDAFLYRTDWTQIAQQTSHHIFRTHTDTHTHQQRISIAIWSATMEQQSVCVWVGGGGVGEDPWKCHK